MKRAFGLIVALLVTSSVADAEPDPTRGDRMRAYHDAMARRKLSSARPGSSRRM